MSALRSRLRHEILLDIRCIVLKKGETYTVYAMNEFLSNNIRNVCCGWNVEDLHAAELLRQSKILTVYLYANHSYIHICTCHGPGTIKKHLQ